jgi:hypothetical protein
MISLQSSDIDLNGAPLSLAQDLRSGTFSGMSGNNFQFAESLAVIKKSRGYSIEELRKNAGGVPRSTLLYWLAGERTPQASRQAEVIALLSNPDNPPSVRLRLQLQRLHNLSWDRSKKSWKLRVTLDLGKKIVGKRITLVLKTADESLAIAKRDAVIAGYRKIGLTVRVRKQARA